MPKPLSMIVLLAVAVAIAGAAAAQDTPDDDSRERPCDNSVHAGFNTTQGNSDSLNLLLGSDLCRQKKGGRWSADLDASVHRADGTSASHRVDLYLFREWHLQRALVVSTFGTGELDPARGLDLRVMAGAGLGKLRQFKWRKGVHAGLHAGLAYTVTDERRGAERGFPEAWSKLDLNVGLTDTLAVASAFHAFSNLEDTKDFRMDARSDVALQVSRRVSLRTGVTINYDHRPAEGADAFDLTTHTFLAFSWAAPAGR